MRNRIAFALTLVRAGKCCRLSARIPNHVSQKQNPCTAKCRKLYVGKRHGSHGVRRENLSVLYRALSSLYRGVARVHEKGIVSGIFACMSSDGCKQDVEG